MATREAAPRRKRLVLEAPKKTRVPKAIGAKIDTLAQMREARQEYARLVREADKVRRLLVEEEDALALEITRELAGDGLKAGRSAGFTFSHAPKEVPRVEDWDELYGYIAEHRAFEMLERRPSAPAFRERWEDGVDVPGVRRESVFGYSLTKRSS